MPELPLYTVELVQTIVQDNKWVNACSGESINESIGCNYVWERRQWWTHSFSHQFSLLAHYSDEYSHDTLFHTFENLAAAGRTDNNQVSLCLILFSLPIGRQVHHGQSLSVFALSVYISN